VLDDDDAIEEAVVEGAGAEPGVGIINNELAPGLLLFFKGELCEGAFGFPLGPRMPVVPVPVPVDVTASLPVLFVLAVPMTLFMLPVLELLLLVLVPTLALRDMPMPGAVLRLPEGLAARAGVEAYAELLRVGGEPGAAGAGVDAGGAAGVPRGGVPPPPPAAP